MVQRKKNNHRGAQFGISNKVESEHLLFFGNFIPRYSPRENVCICYLETYAAAYSVEHYITVNVTEIQSHAAA